MFDDIVDILFDSAFAVEPQGKITGANERCCTALSYAREALLGRDISSIMSKEDAAAIMAIKKDCPQRGMNLTLKASDGETMPVEVNAGIVSQMGKEAILCVARGTAACGQAPENPRDSTLETIAYGYWETDLHGDFIFTNLAMSRFLGKPRRTITVGESFRDYFDDDNVKKMQFVMNEVLHTGNPSTADDYTITRRDGKKAIIQLDISLIEDKLSKTPRFRGFALDVTEQRQMEETLREKEERYRSILESIEDAYWEVDLSGRFTFCNEALCRMAGVPAEHLIGLSNLEYTDAETAKRIYPIFNEIYRTGKPARIDEYKLTRGDGSKAIDELNVSLLRDKDGNPVGLRGISRDVTARRQAEEEIRAHREHLSLINQILSHDLTNSLLVVQSGLNLYKISNEKELLDETEERIRKSLDLISKMRGLESFMSRHRDLRPYNIQDVAKEVAEGYPFIDIRISGQAQVMADDAIYSVIDNIICNAVAHGMADRIEITITEKEDTWCVVCIADNGAGIADEMKENIFDEGFIQGERGNTGLGLHIVRKTMENYGGHVYEERNKPAGAAFFLTFKTI